MCTFSLISRPSAEGLDGRWAYRLAFSRDELRTRPLGLPPRLVTAGGRRALFPTDPASGGTWLGCNDAGLSLAVLNVNVSVTAPAYLTAAERRGRPRFSSSRGGLIPRLLHLGTVEEALAGARLLEPEGCAPFRLVATDCWRMGWLRWDGSVLTSGGAALGDGPGCFVSSGLGDGRVEGPRLGLFGERVAPLAMGLGMAAGDGDAAAAAAARADGAASGDAAGNAPGWCAAAAAQDAFHEHRWPDRGELSVAMDRPDARTVSRAVVEVAREGIVMRYVDLPPEGGAVVSVHRLAWQGLAVDGSEMTQ